MKPKLKKNKNTKNWVVYLNKDDKVYAVADPDMKTAIKKWYEKYSKALGVKPEG